MDRNHCDGAAPMKFTNRLLEMAPKIALAYFSVILPWCLGTLARDVTLAHGVPNCCKQWARIAALSIWLLIGITSFVAACHRTHTDRRVLARCLCLGYLFNVVVGTPTQVFLMN